MLVSSPEFTKGVNSLAKLLNITPHPDHLITLQAISKLICTRLHSQALQNPDLVLVKVISMKKRFEIEYYFAVDFLGCSDSTGRSKPRFECGGCGL